ncbi:hypothetical protein G6F22_015948 [Rhizopus arrhizus]|nr:hypothetical protein G6F22_015948 [Rhizopus arrhizus]
MADQHELRRQEKGEQRVMNGARGEGAQRNGQHGERHRQRRTQQQAQQRCADGAGDAAGDAFEGTLPRGGEIGLQDEYQRQRHPITMVDGECLGQGHGDGGADAHAQGVAEGIGFHPQVLAQCAPRLPCARRAPALLGGRGRRTALVEQRLRDGLCGVQQAVQHGHHRGQIGRIGHGAAAQVMQAGAIVGQTLAQALRLFGVTDVRGAGNRVAHAGVAVQRVRQATSAMKLSSALSSK